MRFVRTCLVAVLGLWVVFGLGLRSTQAVESDSISFTEPSGAIHSGSFTEGNEATTTLTFPTSVRFTGSLSGLLLQEAPGDGFSDVVWESVANIGGASVIVVNFCSDATESATLCADFSGLPVSLGLSEDVEHVKGNLFSFPDGIHGTVVSDADVPEPSTLLLIGSGLVGLAGVAWRRHRK